MLTQFPVGFSIAQPFQHLWDKICKLYSLLLLFKFFPELLFTRIQTQKSSRLKGHPCLEEGLLALLVFWVMASSFLSQEIWTGTILHRARNFNVAAEVTLPWVMTKILITLQRLAGRRRNGKGSEERNIEQGNGKRQPNVWGHSRRTERETDRGWGGEERGKKRGKTLRVFV